MAALTSSPSTPPLHLEAADRLLAMLRSGGILDRRTLAACFAEAAGASDAGGEWTMRDAYLALELAQVRYLLEPGCALLRGVPQDSLAALEAFTRSLPLQSHRSEQQMAWQQFSTPPELSFLAGLAAQPTSRDIALEPSAGTGMLAWTAARAGSRLRLNELDPLRRTLLPFVFPHALLTGIDAELIGDCGPDDAGPTLVLMNPPFARSCGRGEDRYAAGRHLLAALAALAPGGRLVAVMPESFSLSGSGRALRQKAEDAAVLHLDALLDCGCFARLGTSVSIRLLVMDKPGAGGTGKNSSAPAAGRLRSLGDLLDLVERLPGRGEGMAAAEQPAKRSLFLRPARPAAVPARPVPPSATERGTSEAAAELTYQVLNDPAPTPQQVGTYLPYRPSRIAFPDASAHPTPLVESCAMGSVAAPKPSWRPILPPKLVAEGVLSDAQLETLVYAGHAFARDLPGRFAAADEGCALEPADDGAAYRCGYFLGDGTGGGKGRQIAGAMLDQWLRGNRRHIWVSKNEALLEDARRDWAALGGLPLDVRPLSDWKLGAPIGAAEGILFVTYPTLRSGRAEATRLAQVADWAGGEFEGVIAFDEAHAMANAAGGEGSRGRVKGSEQGIAGIRLQNLLPRARVLYASATGASDVGNLVYATRLGLWGPGTAFASREQFAEAIRRGGIAAMELVARDLKAQGLYCARALSFDGVEYDILEHQLTAAQVAVYDAYADAWAIIHAHLEQALEATRVVDAATGNTLNGNARSAAMSRFEGAKQRFFGQLLLSMKLPSLLPAIERDLAAGRSALVQLVSTAEAVLDRRLAELEPDEREALDLDLSPREHVIDYLQAAFPTRQMRLFTDAEGNTRSEPMTDDDGRPVHSAAALAARDQLVEQLCALPPVSPVLDALIERFGTSGVAEVTGRTRRLIIQDGRQRVERRSGRANLAEADAFMRGDKRILVFSDAGGTGRSYHACLGARNQQRRVHYLLEPGWRADAAIQGLGRTHRTRQASAPLFRPVTTDVRGERRFISTIARRLDALGALTRGQRQTGGQNLFDPADNLESGYAKEALLGWYRLLYACKLQSCSFDQFQKLTGLRLEGEDGGLREDLPPIQRWLNRLLALRIALQNAIFDEFLALVEARVDAAREAGTLECGVETLPVEDFRVLEDRVVRTDAATGAATRLLTLELSSRLRPLALEQLRRLGLGTSEVLPLLNSRSGRAALRLPSRSLMLPDGSRSSRYRLVRPCGSEYLSAEQLAESHWQLAEAEAFQAAWTEEAEQAGARLRTEVVHFATGLLLPVWDKLPDDHVRVLRIAAADGRSVLGREVPASALAALSAKLGLGMDVHCPPEQAAASVLAGGCAMPVGGPDVLTLKRSLVNRSQRLELDGFEPARLAWYKSQGCFTEIIRYKTRLFVPIDRASEVLARLAGQDFAAAA